MSNELKSEIRRLRTALWDCWMLAIMDREGNLPDKIPPQESDIAKLAKNAVRELHFKHYPKEK